MNKIYYRMLVLKDEGIPSKIVADITRRCNWDDIPSVIREYTNEPVIFTIYEKDGQDRYGKWEEIGTFRL